MSEQHSIPEVPTSEKFARVMRLIGNDFFYMQGPTYSLPLWFSQIEDEGVKETLNHHTYAIGIMMEPHDPVTGVREGGDAFHFWNIKDGLVAGLRVVSDVYGDKLDLGKVLESVVSIHEEVGRHPAMKKGVQESLRNMGAKGLQELEPHLLAKVMSWEQGVNKERTAMYNEAAVEPRRSDAFGIGFGIVMLASMAQFDHNRFDSILAVGQQEMQQAVEELDKHGWDGEFPEADPTDRG